jgi:putative ABC transport system permease protein
MFLRLLLRASLVKPGRVLSALVAVIVAASVTTAMMNLYVDVQAKLRKEFRSYGANIVVAAVSGHSLPADAIERVEAVLAGRGLAVPFAYAVARTPKGDPVVVAGTDFARVGKLNSWWSITYREGAPHLPDFGGCGACALVGVRAASVVSPDSQPFALTFDGRTLNLTAAGTLRTGAAEDSRVYLDLKDFTTWTGVPPSSLEIAAGGATDEINATIARLSAELPGVEVRPVRQIVEGEARVLGKTRAALLASIVLIILTAALCVLATLTTWVLDRRRDFAIMKALGASSRLVNGFFAAEAAALGAVGALFGFGIGIGVAAWIGRVNFHAAVTPRFSVLPPVLAGSVALALLSAMLPMSILRRTQPATILRGE